MGTLMHARASLRPQGLEHAILQLIALRKGPIGQGGLAPLLRERGFTASTPTIGRKLQEMEFEGLVRKVSVDGRVTTERGREVLREWDAEARLRGSGDALLETLKRGDKKHILDLLGARRIIERETAALAAHAATPAMMRRMGELLDQQEEEISQGRLAIDEDVRFHYEVARASSNTVLASLVALLRTHSRYNYLITSIRAVVRGRMVIEHRAILEGIKKRSPTDAAGAMDRHLQNLIEDIDRYWKRFGRKLNIGGGIGRADQR